MQWGIGHRPSGCQRTMGLHCILILCLFSGWTLGYKQGENVTLYVNKVGPYHNPQETYHYYTLPVCRPEKVSLFFFLFGCVLKAAVIHRGNWRLFCHVNVRITPRSQHTFQHLKGTVTPFGHTIQILRLFKKNS